jgi:hypothetical protein
MKTVRVLCVLCGLVLAASALDREAFTFAKYDLNVRVEPEQQRLGVRGRITLRNDSAALQKHAVLQISSSLSWRSIQADGKPLEFVTQPYVSDIDHTGSLSEAIVTLPQAVPAKGTVELDIGYEGTIPLDATRLTRIGVPEETARHTDWDQIGKSFTAVRGVGYVAWYPVAMESANLSEGDSVFEALGRWKAREAGSVTDLNMCVNHADETVPAVIANGRRVGEDSLTSCIHYAFEAGGNLNPTFAIAQYTLLVRQNAEIAYLPEHRSAAEDYALALDLVTPFVSEWFGAPRERTRVVELADPQAAPFEGSNMLFAPLNARTDVRLAQLTAVHQVTHAAFSSPRLWIYEGLAHFSQAAYREQQDGRRAALDFMEAHRTAVVEAERTLAADKKDSAGRSLVSASVEEFYRSKAMYVWWMLRDMVGEEALKRALTAYHADQDKEPSYVQRLVEAQSKRDLEWFFDDWVYRDRGLPDFRVESAYPRQILGGGYMVTVTVANLGDAGAEVPVTLRFAGGEVSKRLEVHGKAKGVIRMEVPAAPQEVVVNDGSVPENDMGNNSFKIEGRQN